MQQRQQQQQQQQMYGSMQDPFYGDLNRLASQQLPSASMAQQQRSPGLRASPGLGANLASMPSARSDMGLGMGLDPSMGQYGLQGKLADLPVTRHGSTTLRYFLHRVWELFLIASPPSQHKPNSIQVDRYLAS